VKVGYGGGDVAERRCNYTIFYVKEVAIPESLATRLLEGEGAIEEFAEVVQDLVKYGDVAKRVLERGGGEVYVVDGKSVVRLAWGNGALIFGKMELLEFLQSYNPFEPGECSVRQHTVIYRGRGGSEEFYVGSQPSDVRQFLLWFKERLPEVLGGEELQLAEGIVREKLEAVEKHILETARHRW